MNANERAKAPDMEAVAEFWAEAVSQMEHEVGAGLFGEQAEVGLFPPAFQYSDNRAEATQMAREVLDGERTTFVSALADYDGPDIARPADGDMSIICNGDGMPVALISDTNVKIEADPKSPGSKFVVETFEVIFPVQK